MTRAPNAKATTITHVSNDFEADTRPLSLRLIVRLLGYALKYKWTFFGLLLAVLIRSIQLPLLVAVLQQVIRGPIEGRDMDGVINGVLIFAGIAIFTELTFHFRGRLALELGERVIHDLRRDIFEHIQLMTMSFFDKTKIGRIISRMTSDAEALRMGVQDVLFVPGAVRPGPLGRRVHGLLQLEAVSGGGGGGAAPHVGV
jgi:ATP-binding cassette subfamily B protein